MQLKQPFTYIWDNSLRKTCEAKIRSKPFTPFGAKPYG